jgi:hypothetical protein
MRLDDLNVGVGRLKALLEVLAGTKPSNQEDCLERMVSFFHFSHWQTPNLDLICLGVALGQSLNVHKVDLIFYQSLDIGDEGLEDFFDIIATSVII